VVDNFLSTLCKSEPAEEEEKEKDEEEKDKSLVRLGRDK